jgi:peptidoglycan/xylan/chitin deacetylase (PgdA/CDA1 family)
MSLKATATSAANKTGNLILSPPYGGFGFYHNHGPRTVRKVAFTFDDGPSKPATEHMLDTLDRTGDQGHLLLRWPERHLAPRCPVANL